MSFIIALIINGLIIGKIQKVAITHTWKNLNPKQRLPLIISGTVSTLCSLGAFTCAFFINEF